MMSDQERIARLEKAVAILIECINQHDRDVYSIGEHDQGWSSYGIDERLRERLDALELD